MDDINIAKQLGDVLGFKNKTVFIDEDEDEVLFVSDVDVRNFESGQFYVKDDIFSLLRKIKYTIKYVNYNDKIVHLFNKEYIYYRYNCETRKLDEIK